MKTFTFVWTTLALGILVMAGLWFRPVAPPLPASLVRKGKASAGASAPAARTNAAALTTRLPGETLLQSLLRQGRVGLPGSALEYLQAVPTADFPDILREIEQMEPSPQRTILLSDLHEAWAERDSAAALESALKSGNEAIKGALAGWTKAAPADAWAWVDRPETKASFRIGELDSFYRAVLDTLGRRNDESTAASLLDTLPASAMRMTMAGQLAETWAVKAPRELIQWLQRNETKDKDATGFAAHFLGLELARKGAEAVQDVIGTQSDLIANSVLGAAVSRWVKEGQNDQLDSLLRSLPGVTVQRADIIYAQVGSGTAPTDPSGGLALLLNIQDPAARNRWLSNTAASLVQTAPSDAMDYVLAISDATTRETRAKRVYSQWAAKDPEGARSKVDAESFPPALRAVLVGGN